MFDLDATVRTFYSDKVAIPKAVRDMLRDARRKNEDRLEAGLKKEGKPKVKRHVPQGGYRMKTVVQQPGDAYDIDNGAAFTYESLLTVNGEEMSALDARKMVCAALQDPQFKEDPVVRNHCVRVYYERGYWVDVPVYRQRTDEVTNQPYLELASTDWRRSDPEGVTTWFQNVEQQRSPDVDAGGDPQFRRIVAYIKFLAKSRESWNWPTGFMISVLVSESYYASERDDIALRQTLNAIRYRLLTNTKIDHPVIYGERLDRGDPDARCVEMRDKLADLLGYLEALDSASCDDATAAAAWDKVFGSDYFRDKIGEAAKAMVSFGASGNPRRFERGDGGRYG